MLAATLMWLILGASSLFPASTNLLRSGAHYTIDAWENDDGLLQSSVISMTRTRDGYLWLGTRDSLVRFDGVQFTGFDESNAPGLRSSPVILLFEDSRRRLWIGTENAGLAVLQDGEVTRPGIGSGSREGRAVAACEDSVGAVWLCTADGQLWREHKGVTNAFPVGASSRRSLIVEDTGMIWVGSDWRLLGLQPTADFGKGELPVAHSLPVGRLDFLLASRRGGYWRLAGGQIQKWRGNQPEGAPVSYRWDTFRTPISTACEDSEGNLIVGTLGEGLFWFDGQGNVARLGAGQGLSHNYILSLDVDGEGTLWVGTDGGGLNRVKRQFFDVVEQTRSFVVQSVCEDDDGGLWIGSNGSGVQLWKEGRLQPFTQGQGLMNPYVWSVFVDRQRQVWAGTYDGLFQWQTNRFQRAVGSGVLPAVVQAMHEDRAGRLWVGTRGGLAQRDAGEWKLFTTRDGLASDVIRAIADDAQGNLWIGTEGGGLNRFRDGQFTRVGKSEGVAAETVSSLCVDSDGVLWIGTQGSGLVRMQDGKCAVYTVREGLVSNHAGYLVEDGQGYLWIGSNAGLMRVPRKALDAFARGTTNFVPCRVYGKPDGLVTRECTMGSQPGAWRTRDGRLWFATIKGAVSVNPAQLSLNTNPPPVVIESVLIDGQPENTNRLRTTWTQPVTVAAGKERIEIRYTGLSLSAPDRARFKYRLEGHETAWIEAGNTRTARYSKLPPGEYQFQVTACNEDGFWNPSGSTLAFVVQPPFWRTAWFLTSAASGLLGAVAGMVYWLATRKLQRQLQNLKQQEALEKERSRIARDLHDQLGASLTQVSLLGELAESDKDLPEEVEAHARQITQTARDTTRVLDEIVWAVNPSNDTLDGLITYACKYAQEYLAVAGVRYRLDVPGQLPATVLPPDLRHNVFLAFKEAITNVVRHAQASAVCVRLRLEAAAFSLEIVDNGRGFSELDEKKGRNGLRNMRRRMEDVGGSFTAEANPEGGAVVRLTAPLGKSPQPRGA